VVAPYDVHLVSLPGKGDQAADVVAAADRLYDELTGAGVDVLYDDRDTSPGIKFADADLLGMPTRLTVGARGLARGVVERRDRATGQEEEIAVTDVAAAVLVSRA
jgi:prolyl-tRNA synthetase